MLRNTRTSPKSAILSLIYECGWYKIVDRKFVMKPFHEQFSPLL